MKIPVQIERALPADADRLTEIALAAKRHWKYPERWIEIWRPSLTISSEYISSEPVFLARVDHRIAGFYGLLHRDGALWLEHLWVLPAYMGRGIGAALYRHALETAFAGGASVVKIEADPNAEAFYRRMGARRRGEVASEIEGHRRVLPLLEAASSR